MSGLVRGVKRFFGGGRDRGPSRAQLELADAQRKDLEREEAALERRRQSIINRRGNPLLHTGPSGLAGQDYQSPAESGQPGSGRVASAVDVKFLTAAFFASKGKR